jgi:hypothetical protein
MKPSEHKPTILASTMLVTAALIIGSLLMARGEGSGWMAYTSEQQDYQVNYPASWKVQGKGDAVVITSPGEPPNRGVFGITPRKGKLTSEEAVQREMSAPDRPADLVRSAARIAELPAIKVVGSKKGDPATRIVEYYVQAGLTQYYVLFQGPSAAWVQYSPTFNAMIRSLKILKTATP